MTEKIFYLTTAIDYVNGRPHLGHAYEKIAADAVARFRRLQGREVSFLVGTDEHSRNVARAAAAAGRPVREYCDGMAGVFQDVYQQLGISYDRFLRTSSSEHALVVEDLVRRAAENGYVHHGIYEGWYCVSCEAFLDETDLADGECPTHPGKPADWVREENYFFALSRFQSAIIAHLEAFPAFIQPAARRHEILNRLHGGIKDISISRSAADWGIPLPFEPSHVVYVWFDALAGYLTSAGYLADPGRFAHTWPADVQVIGKDISWFHCVIWPAMLLAAGLPLPGSIHAHGHILSGGRRFSKSAGNTVDPLVLAETYGVDALRYYLLREIPWGGDGDFTPAALVKRYNSDLANDLGNLLSRCTAMIEKYCGGIVPAPGETASLDREIPAVAALSVSTYEGAMEEMDFSAALEAIWRLVGRANKYLDETVPWRLAADASSRARLGTVLYQVAEALRIAAVVLQPFLVETPARILDQLGLEGKGPRLLEEAHTWGLLPPGTTVRRGEPIFPRITNQ